MKKVRSDNAPRGTRVPGRRMGFRQADHHRISSDLIGMGSKKLPASEV
jgi:hypothetical protein